MLIFSAFLGVSIAINSISLFHIALALNFIAFFVFLCVKPDLIFFKYRILFELFLFVLFIFLWLSFSVTSLDVFGRYLAYLFFGFFAFAAVVFRVIVLRDLPGFIRIAVTAVTIAFLLGMLEVGDIYRLPTSKVFDHPDQDFVFRSFLQRAPTSFYFNRNDFAFFLVAFAPFIFFCTAGFIRASGFVVTIVFLVFIGSKAAIGSFILLLLASQFFIFRGNLKVGLALLGWLGLLSVAVIFLKDTQILPTQRIFFIFDSIHDIYDIIFKGLKAQENSVGVRAGLYLEGAAFMSQYPLLGVGLGGFEARTGSSFHFFFFQLLVELGLVFGGYLIIRYLALAAVLLRQGAKLKNKSGRLASATGLSLLFCIPASVGVSSLYYFLPFYVLLGFSVSLKLYMRAN